MELVLPNNCVVIEQEEMVYLDGSGLPNWFVTNSIYTLITLAGLGSGVAGMRTFIKMHGKYLAKKNLQQNLARVGLGFGAIMISTMVDLAFTWLDPIGAAVNWADGRIDSKKDGWLFGAGWDKWY